MEKLQKCRLCLMGDVRMHMVDKNLQEIYEKITNIPFVTEDCRPMVACFICYNRLKQCCQLQRKCLEADKLFAQMSNEDCENVSLTNHGQPEFSSGFMVSPMEINSIVDGLPIENYVIKEELSPNCEGQDDVELKKQQQSDAEGGVRAEEDGEDKI